MVSHDWDQCTALLLVEKQRNFTRVIIPFFVDRRVKVEWGLGKTVRERRTQIAEYKIKFRTKWTKIVERLGRGGRRIENDERNK
jgi:hypothetical protein